LTFGVFNLEFKACDFEKYKQSNKRFLKLNEKIPKTPLDRRGYYSIISYGQKMIKLSGGKHEKRK